MPHLPKPASLPARWRSLIACATVTTAMVAVPAPSAQAADCYSFAKVDPLGFVWDAHYGGEGSVDNGTYDAYDGFGSLNYAGSSYFPDDDAACGYDENRAEHVYPVSTAVAGLEATRKLYVPDSGAAFARWLDIIENTGATPQTINIIFSGNLGSDNSTVVVSSSDGDALAEPGEPWISTDDGTDNGPSASTNDDDPALGHVADGSAAEGRREVNDGWGVTAGTDTFNLTYNDVTVPAGGRVILMHLEAQRNKRADATAAAEALAAGPAEVFAQMSAAEGADVVNWAATDFDSDGVANTADNCLYDANANQSDVDGDGQGDACDEDVDGDGLSNQVETAIGTDPAKADTDGDGVRDDADRCPVTPGTQANGCRAEDTPPTVAITSPSNGTEIDPGEPTTITAAASDDRGVASVVFVDDGKVIGQDSTAPYSIVYRPKGEDVGRNTIAAVAVDGAGQTATAFLQLVSERFAADGLSAKTSPKADGSLPYRFTTKGRIDLPEGVTAAEACRGKVSVQIKAGKKTVSNRRARVRGNCSYRSRVTFTLPGRLNPSKLKVVTRFRGNAVLKPRRAKTRTVRAG